MKVEINGAVARRSHNKVASNKGRTEYIKTEVEYVDNEILTLLDYEPGLYGRHWVYVGDQGFHESNIHVVVTLDDGAKSSETFAGRTGLNETVKFLRNKGVTKPKA